MPQNNRPARNMPLQEAVETIFVLLRAALTFDALAAAPIEDQRVLRISAFEEARRIMRLLDIDPAILNVFDEDGAVASGLRAVATEMGKHYGLPEFHPSLSA